MFKIDKPTVFDLYARLPRGLYRANARLEAEALRLASSSQITFMNDEEAAQARDQCWRIDPCPGFVEARSALVPAVLNRRLSHGGPMVRIHLPPPASLRYLKGGHGGRVSFSETNKNVWAYGTDLVELWRRLADDVHQVLNGANPGEFPIYQPTKFEFLINLKSASAIGLTLPPTLLDSADEVIE
jgi:hypothetical protein